MTRLMQLLDFMVMKPHPTWRTCLQERQQQGKSRKEALQQALQTGQRLIIDLDFQDFMSESELKSLCKQIVYCWSANLKVRQQDLQHVAQSGRQQATPGGSCQLKSVIGLSCSVLACVRSGAAAHAHRGHLALLRPLVRVLACQPSNFQHSSIILGSIAAVSRLLIPPLQASVRMLLQPYNPCCCPWTLLLMLQAEKPCHMVLASYQGAVQRQLQQQAPDMGNWILTTDVRGLSELAKDQ